MGPGVKRQIAVAETVIDSTPANGVLDALQRSAILNQGLRHAAAFTCDDLAIRVDSSRRSLCRKYRPPASLTHPALPPHVCTPVACNSSTHAWHHRPRSARFVFRLEAAGGRQSRQTCEQAHVRARFLFSIDNLGRPRLNPKSERKNLISLNAAPGASQLHVPTYVKARKATASAQLTTKTTSTGRPRKPALASTAVSTVRPLSSLCIANFLVADQQVRWTIVPESSLARASQPPPRELDLDAPQLAAGCDGEHVSSGRPSIEESPCPSDRRPTQFFLRQ